MLFAPEGNYQDNVMTSLTKQGEAEPLFSMVHKTKNDKERLSYETVSLWISAAIASPFFVSVTTPSKTIETLFSGTMTIWRNSGKRQGWKIR